jgi:hypothetical protein
MEKHKIGTDVTVLSDQAEVPGVPEFVGPDQEALEALLATFEPV